MEENVPETQAATYAARKPSRESLQLGMPHTAPRHPMFTVCVGILVEPVRCIRLNLGYLGKFLLRTLVMNYM